MEKSDTTNKDKLEAKLNTESNSENGDGNVICQLVEQMRSVDIDSPEAKLNITTISDGKGGRIRL